MLTCSIRLLTPNGHVRTLCGGVSAPVPLEAATASSAPAPFTANAAVQHTSSEALESPIGLAYDYRGGGRVFVSSKHSVRRHSFVFPCSAMRVSRRIYDHFNV